MGAPGDRVDDRGRDRAVGEPVVEEVAEEPVAETAPVANRAAVRGSRSRKAWAMRICLEAAWGLRLQAAATAAWAHAQPSIT